MRISKKLEDILGTLDCPVSRDLLASERTEKGDYLSVKGGFMTYLPAGKETDKPWASKNRVRGKAGKIARNFCTDDHTDREYENFYNGVVGLSFGPENLSIVKGLDIMEVYLYNKDERKQSRMMSSCMTHDVTEENFRLYTENPDKVRLLVMWDTFKGEKVAIGRCLIWKTEQGIYADRVYGSEPAIAYIQSYIKNKGWGRWGDGIRPRRVIFEDEKRYQVMPYLDSFRETFAYNEDGTMYLRT